MARPIKEVDKGKIATTEKDLAYANEQIEYWRRVSHAHGLQLEAIKKEAIENIELDSDRFTIGSRFEVVDK